MKLKLSVNKDTHVENIIKKIKSKVVLSHKDSDLKLCYVLSHMIVYVKF